MNRNYKIITIPAMSTAEAIMTVENYAHQLLTDANHSHLVHVDVAVMAKKEIFAIVKRKNQANNYISTTYFIMMEENKDD